MSILLAIASIYMGAKLVEEVAKDVTKIPARKAIQDDSKKGNFDVVKNFEEILYVCDVKRKKHNSSVAVLPYGGYNKCMKYLQNHHLVSKADERRFIDYYNKVLSKELSHRQCDYDKKYLEVKSNVERLMENDNYDVVRFEHINVFVDYEDVKQKVDEICNNTFFGDFAVADVKIKEGGPTTYTEIWALKIPVVMKYNLKKYYRACSNRCGYIY